MKQEKKPLTLKSVAVGTILAAIFFGGIYFFVYHFMLSAFRKGIPIP